MPLQRPWQVREQLAPLLPFARHCLKHESKQAGARLVCAVDAAGRFCANALPPTDKATIRARANPADAAIFGERRDAGGMDAPIPRNRARDQTMYA